MAVNGLDIMLTLQSLSFGSNPKESIKRSGSWFSRKKYSTTGAVETSVCNMLERKHVFPMLRLPRRPTGARVAVVVVR